MKKVNFAFNLNEATNNRDLSQEDLMKRQEFITKWYEENGHLLEAETS